jgi:hypothetical protein
MSCYDTSGFHSSDMPPTLTDHSETQNSQVWSTDCVYELIVASIILIEETVKFQTRDRVQLCPTSCSFFFF